MFLSKINEELFKVIETPLNYSNLIKEEWQAIQPLAGDRSIVIKKQIRVLLYVFRIE